MGEGSFRKAFSVFQKAQESQPALPGIDYLVGYSALKAGEVALAKESLQHAVSKNEMDAEAKVLLALISLDESEKGKNGSEQMTDPVVTAESELRHYATTHPLSPGIYRQWGDMQRKHGSYRTAADLYHKAFLRSDPDEQLSLLAAREVLTRLQNQPAKELPSLAWVTSMTGEEALGAALASLQNKSPSNAVFFLQRAKECFPQRAFREVMNDAAFDEYKPDSKISKFLETSFSQASKP
jgi:tetratricopeptide (TPR) repeat protein